MDSMIHGYIKVTYLVTAIKNEVETILKPYLQRKVVDDEKHTILYELLCSISEWQSITLQLAPDATAMLNSGQRFNSLQIKVSINAYQVE